MPSSAPRLGRPASILASQLWSICAVSVFAVLVLTGLVLRTLQRSGDDRTDMLRTYAVERRLVTLGEEMFDAEARGAAYLQTQGEHDLELYQSSIGKARDTIDHLDREMSEPGIAVRIAIRIMTVVLRRSGGPWHRPWPWRKPDIATRHCTLLRPQNRSEPLTEVFQTVRSEAAEREVQRLGSRGDRTGTQSPRSCSGVGGRSRRHSGAAGADARRFARTPPDFQTIDPWVEAMERVTLR